MPSKRDNDDERNARIEHLLIELRARPPIEPVSMKLHWVHVADQKPFQRNTQKKTA